MDLSLDLYRVFYFVAKNLSFSKAAQELFVSQSAVSQSIRQLEQKIGYPLLLRTTKKLTLTNEGEMFYSYLQQAFSILEIAERNLHNHLKEDEGEIRIACTDTLCKYYLLPKIQELSMDFPKIKIKIINGTSKHCLKKLEQSDMDFAIINLPDTLDEHKFIIEKTYPFQDVFIAKKNTPYLSMTTLETLATVPLLILDHASVTRLYFDRLFQSAGICILPEIELQSIDVLVEMAKTGLGVAFVPDLCVQGRTTEIDIVPLKDPIPPRAYGVVSRKKVPLSPIGETFLNYLT